METPPREISIIETGRTLIRWYMLLLRHPSSPRLLPWAYVWDTAPLLPRSRPKG